MRTGIKRTVKSLGLIECIKVISNPNFMTMSI